MSSGITDTDARAELLDVLRTAEKTIVVTHEHPDGDALGSLIAMHALLGQLGGDSLMYIVPSDLPLPYEYAFLSVEGVVTAAPADIDTRTIVFLDCGNVDRNPGAQALRSAHAWERVINIDHHHDNTRFGTVNFVQADASCTAEIVWELAQALGLELTLPVAEALYVGLITDTGCFMYENTGPRAHEMAASLIEAGVDVHAIYRHVYEGVPFGKLELLARGLANASRFDGGRLTASQLSAEEFAQAGAEPSYSEGVVDHLRAVRGTAMAALVRDRIAADGSAERDEHGVRQRKVSLRTADDRVDVSAIARLQGGGGHRAAAGFSTSMSWEQLIAFLREQLRSQLPA